MAFWMDQVARGWLIYELTDSALQLGLVRGVQAIPTLLLSPVAGSTADRYSRKTQILVAQVIDGLMLAALALLIVTGQIQPWHVYATAFGMAVVQTFQQPARAAMIADLVPSSHLTNAIGLNSIIFNVARSTGPALAGVLIATFGTAGSYATQAVFYLLATVWTAQLQPAERSSPGFRGHSGHGASLGRSIIDGWKFSWKNEAVRTSLLVVMLASLFIVPFTTLLPVFARDILDVGATGQGLLLTAMGVGALGSAIIIAFFGDRMPRGIFMLGGVALYGTQCRGLRGIALVSSIHGADGDRRFRQRVFPCPRANGDSNLLPFRIPRPNHGHFSHEQRGDDVRQHAYRRSSGRLGHAVGDDVDEPSGYACHGCDPRYAPQRAAYPVGRRVFMTRLPTKCAERLFSRLLVRENQVRDARNSSMARLTSSGFSAKGKWPAFLNFMYCEPGTA